MVLLHLTCSSNMMEVSYKVSKIFFTTLAKLTSDKLRQKNSLYLKCNSHLEIWGYRHSARVCSMYSYFASSLMCDRDVDSWGYDNANLKV